jgi:hypothetical protein
MRNLLTAMLFAGAIGSASAAPITLTDIFNPNPDYLFDGSASTATLNFTQSLLDDGFNALTDTLTSASITLRFKDESTDVAPESVSFALDGLSFGTRTITSGGAIFTVTFSDSSLLGLLSDGLLDVTLTNAGTLTGASSGRSDFLFLDSTLTVDGKRKNIPAGNDPQGNGPQASVPEPGTFALLGLASALGFALTRRRRIS